MNSITGENDSIASGQLNITAIGDSISGSAYGMYADNNSSNVVKVDDVSMQVDNVGNATGIYTGTNSTTTIEGESLRMYTSAEHGNAAYDEVLQAHVSEAAGIKTEGGQVDITLNGVLDVNVALWDGKTAENNGTPGQNNAYGIAAGDDSTNTISAGSINIWAKSSVTTAASTEEAGNQYAYGVAAERSQDGGEANNYISLTDDYGYSQITAIVDNTTGYPGGGHNRMAIVPMGQPAPGNDLINNDKSAYALYSKGGSTSNVIAGSVSSDGVVEKIANHLGLAAEAGSGRGHHIPVEVIKEGNAAYGMYAEHQDNGASTINTVAANSVEININSANDGYAMYASADYAASLDDNHAINTIIAKDVTINIDAGGREYAMYASNGGENIIKYVDDGSIDGVSTSTDTHNDVWYHEAIQDGQEVQGEIQLGEHTVHYEIQGDIHAEDGSRNIINTGAGDHDDVVIIEGNLYADATSKNIIDTGAGDDTVIINGDIYGDTYNSNEILTGAGDDHLYLLDPQNMNGTTIDGGDGVDTLHLYNIDTDYESYYGEQFSNSYSLSDLTRNNVLKSIEVLDMTDGTKDELLLDSLLNNIQGIDALDSSKLGAVQGANDDMSGALGGENVLRIHGDASDVVYAGDYGWGKAGSANYDGINYDVYTNTNGDLVMIDQNMNII